MKRRNTASIRTRIATAGVFIKLIIFPSPPMLKATLPLTFLMLIGSSSELFAVSMKGVLEGKKAKILEAKEMGQRELAYEINKKREGYYVLVNFTAEESVPNKLSALLAITNNIMRNIIVVK